MMANPETIHGDKMTSEEIGAEEAAEGVSGTFSEFDCELCGGVLLHTESKAGSGYALVCCNGECPACGKEVECPDAGDVCEDVDESDPFEGMPQVPIDAYFPCAKF